MVTLDRVSRVFESRRGLFGSVRRVWAVKSVSLGVGRAEALGLVGESGSGKTTLARLMTGLLEPTSGKVLVQGADLALTSGSTIRRLRRSVQMIFQDPVSALDPRQTVFEALAEVVTIGGEKGRRNIRERIESTLSMVELRPEDSSRYPHELSGGQCQRVGIARALISSPAVLIADEPVAHLDVSTQAAIVSLLARLRSRLGLTVVLIAHDLSMVRQAVDRVAVILNGRIVEAAPVGEMFSRPLHPYTQALLEAVPRPGRPPRGGAEGDPGGWSSGSGDAACPYVRRCPGRREGCESGPVDLTPAGGPTHWVRCPYVRPE